jgi:hypothetical protein
MKKFVAIAFCALLTVGAWAASAPDESWAKPRFDLNTQGTLVLPTGDNNADYTDALEFKGVYWFTSLLGAGVSWGFGDWFVEDEAIRPPYVLPAVEDDETDLAISTMPIGASLYLRPWVNGRFSLNLEAGVRYVYAWDDLVLEWDGETAGDDDVLILVEHEADVDNAWVGLLGVDLEYNVSSAFYMSLGAGYQFDLGDAEYSLWNGRENELSYEGVGLRASLGLRF